VADRKAFLLRMDPALLVRVAGPGRSDSHLERRRDRRARWQPTAVRERESIQEINPL
jgi:hypothetical protein